MNITTKFSFEKSVVFEYVDTICEGLDNVLFVRGSGEKVITK